ncbi:MAG: hypothetical protein DM484_18950 [Candidatus Methylumidiphilus alinenensis]|uniref:SH3b domain-containing protein n=1 Tax=Candidatus Methylumidiphilus alinenensis TaxID=2202197 RepID=A0A2W4QVI9_9GAMM|nr:MAG: hypothetical protein DM484_18950 [Candidatus Methylumidiphilus alinenensis]
MKRTAICLLTILSLNNALSADLCKGVTHRDVAAIESPDSTYTEIMRMTGNTILNILREKDQWYYVKNNSGITGWVNKRWICKGQQ